MSDELPQAAVTPAERIIRRFGVKTIADWTERHASRVHAWTWPTSRGGTGGVIPHSARARIIDGAARDKGEVVSFAEFEPEAGERYLLDAGNPAVLAAARAS